MRSVSNVIVTCSTGILLGAVTTYFVVGNESVVPAKHQNDRLTNLIEQHMHQTELLLSEIKTDIAATGLAQQEITVAHAEEWQKRHTGAEPMVEYPPTEEIAVTDITVEDAMVQNIITRLYDPDYTRSTNLSEIMQSEEMSQLSSESRERVVAEMVGMLNRGEIDADTFLSNQLEQ